jgi:hypothetical protein
MGNGLYAPKADLAASVAQTPVSCRSVAAPSRALWALPDAVAGTTRWATSQTSTGSTAQFGHTVLTERLKSSYASRILFLLRPLHIHNPQTIHIFDYYVYLAEYW